MREYKVLDGTVKVGDKVWWHCNEGPELQIVKEYDRNMAQYPDIYSISEPEWNDDIGYTGNFVSSVDYTKPPIGIPPKCVYMETCITRRVKDIREAMKRYIEDNKEIPVEWLKELIDIQEGNW
jgi:hypothetical protein